MGYSRLPRASGGGAETRPRASARLRAAPICAHCSCNSRTRDNVIARRWWARPNTSASTRFVIRPPSRGSRVADVGGACPSCSAIGNSPSGWFYRNKVCRRSGQRPGRGSRPLASSSGPRPSGGQEPPMNRWQSCCTRSSDRDERGQGQLVQAAGPCCRATDRHHRGCPWRPCSPCRP